MDSKLSLNTLKLNLYAIINFLDSLVEHVSIVYSFDHTGDQPGPGIFSTSINYLGSALQVLFLFSFEGAILIGPSPKTFQNIGHSPKVKKHRGSSLWPTFIICNICVFVWNFNFGQSIWDKSAVPLGTSWGNLWELDGNIFKIARKETMDGMHQSNIILD